MTRTLPHWTVGDRLAAVRVLLPAEPGPVPVLAVGEVLRPHLAAALPEATTLDEAPADGWTLLVVEAAGHDVEALRHRVAPGGTVAVLGPHGQHAVYPAADRPELVWRRGWPVSGVADPAAWVRRRAALALARRHGSFLDVTGADRPTLADEVLAQLEHATGVPGRLVGVVTAGHTVLRVRTADGDVAVRLSIVHPDRDPDPSRAVLADVPELAPLLPATLASGTVRGLPWVAVEWVPRRRSTGGWPWPTAESQADGAEAVVDALAARPTGETGPGWAADWCERAHVVPLEVRAAWAEQLAVLERGVPTAWCHGDLWSGNVLADGDRRVVIDWDNASADAPLGLDRVLRPALREAGEPGRNVTTELFRLVDEVDLLGDAEVAGRPWTGWDRAERRALVLAAVVLYLRNRSEHDLPPHELAAHLSAARTGLETPVAVPTTGTEGLAAARTARGALWLATNGIVVKTSQTVVLLALAALLAPEALGLVALGTLVANASAVVTSLGTASALVYWRGDVERAARTAVTIGAGMGIALAGLLWAAAPWLARTLGAADGAPVIRGLTAVLPCLAVAAVTNELLRRRLLFLRRIVPDTVSSVVGAVVAIALVAGGSGVMALVAGQVVQAVLTLLLSWCVHPPVLPGWNREDARGLLTYGGPYAGANLLELVQLNVDYLIVSAVLGPVALGQYSLAFRLSFMPYLMIVVVITGAAFPYLCRMRGRRLGEAATVVMTATLTLVLPLCAGVALLADHLTLLGEKWEPGVPVVAWLAGYAVLLSVGQLVQVTLNASGRPAVTMTVRLCHLLLLVASLSVVAHHGVVPVAVTQLAVAGCVALLAVTLARVLVRGFSLRALGRALRPAAAGVVAMVVVVLAARTLLALDGPSVGSLVGLALLGAAAYAVPVWLLDRQHLLAAARLIRRTS
ncbi:oligosaccharide flippase family protein [Nocardioides lianchengensis]|uniref:Membrane protein involved in the export of O-antigen and teichoic acid n=1 Tax=Nocardioides lianchengensis TaxID=1045774 RepID=A0A1G6WXY8_9ACTN|nr:oligosaccharide flippase family protein [Nocardioides lianchengensis]NYG09166.1 O-antigen/teichoic acid export membrane protein [Nocardioides lianchengensis]SDD70513.1 Membrane protein involved in the export of O-antigen and teichoic acid [Nocardioides lianchengensis]